MSSNRERRACKISPGMLFMMIISLIGCSCCALGSESITSIQDPDATPQTAAELQDRVDSYIAKERPIALAGLLCNIGAEGSCVPGASPGLVIASPSKKDPPYFYTWTRDSALVFKCIVDEFMQSYDPLLQNQIQNYITAQARLQRIHSPSGDLSSGGLGEPKFEANGTQFTGTWGRPQRDGPALRAIALITYANWLINNGYSSTAASLVWPVIQNDLYYVAQYWNSTGFDLWEEVLGSSFFTLAAHHRSLVEGKSLAARLGKLCTHCDSEAPAVLCFLQKFWCPSQRHVLANINSNDGRSKVDANVILTSIHNFDPDAGCDASTFQPCSDRALSSHRIVTDSFRSIYKVNLGKMQHEAVAVGRYPEDIYYGGNPWYLLNLAAAEQLYAALYTWRKQKFIVVNSISLDFFRALVPSITTGTYTDSHTSFDTISMAVKTYADGYVALVMQYAGNDGSLDEQFSRDDGSPLSAVDLTWSYAAFLSMAARRAELVPDPWIVPTATSVPAICPTADTHGTYSEAPTSDFPPNQTPKLTRTSTETTSGSRTTTSPSCPIASEVAIVFKVLARSEYGQTIKILGNHILLGNWNIEEAIALDAKSYTSENPLWKVAIGGFKPGDVLKYKFINVDTSRNGQVVWEGEEDRYFKVERGCESQVVVEGRWRDASGRHEEI